MGIEQRLLPAVIAAALWACGVARAQEVRHEYVELHMGVAVRIVLYAPPPPDTSGAAAARAAYARVAQLEDVMSDYRPESEVRRLADRPGTAVPVSAELFTVMARALEVWRASDGAFDPTVGPFVELWRASRRTGRLPPQDQLAAAARRVSAGHVHLDSTARTVRLDLPGMRVDLGGIAKGYILDLALAELRRRGVTRVLLEAGGDIVLGDAPPGLPGWRIAVPGGSPVLRARADSLANVAVSTSGDTEQFVIIDGIHYSHVIDPRTGLGLTTRRQATVIAPDGLTADPLATALVVLDDSGAARLLRAYPQVVAEVRRAPR